MLCVAGWDKGEVTERLSVVADGLPPGNLTQLSISNSVLESLGLNLPQLEYFSRRHGAWIHRLHLRDQVRYPALQQNSVLHSLLKWLPNLVTLHIGSTLGRRGTLGGEWEYFADLFLTLGDHCENLRYLHIFHDVIFWNDPASLRLYQHSVRPHHESWCDREHHW